MIKKTNFLAPTVALGIFVSSLLVSPSALAQAGCDPALKQVAQQKQQKALKEELEHLEKVYGGHMKQPDWLSKSDGLLTACYKANWPAYKPSLPILATLYKMAQEKLVKAACDKARGLVSDGASNYQSIIKTIPGYEQVQDIKSGSLGNWGQIGDVMGDLPTGGTVDWGQIQTMIPGGATLPGITPVSTPPINQPSSPAAAGIPGVSPNQ